MADWTQGDVIRCQARIRSQGQTLIGTFHYRMTGPSISSDAGIFALAEQIDEMYDVVQPAMNSAVTFVDLDFANVTKQEVYAAIPWPTQTAGGSNQEPQANQVSALVVGRTNRPKTIGRKFLGPFTEIETVSGQWGGGFLGALQDFVAAYLASVTVGANTVFTPVVAHYIAGGLIAWTTDIISGIYSSIPATQRRRRLGVGQ